MLIKILFSYFSLANIISLAKKIRSLLIEKFPENPMLASVLSSMDANLELAIEAFGSTTKQVLTKEVQAADMKRDNSFRSLRDHVRAGLLRENESYRLACEALWTEFEKNGLNLFSVPYSEETAGITSLLNDLRSADNQVHLQTIFAVDWAEELDRDNNAFVALSRQRSAARSGDSVMSDQNAFKQLKVSLELMSNILNTLYAMNEPEGIREVVAEVNQYIRESNASAKLSESHEHTPPANGQEPTYPS